MYRKSYKFKHIFSLTSSDELKFYHVVMNFCFFHILCLNLIFFKDVKLKICLNLYDFWYISRHTSAASSSHHTGTSALDASCSHLTDTYLFSLKRISDRKNIISWSPGNLMVSASPAHHIRGIWAKVLRYIWKDKPDLHAFESRSR